MRYLAFILMMVIVTPIENATGDSGSLSVQVLYRGAVPPPQELPVPRDTDTCGATVKIQPIMVTGSGKLKDVVIAVEGLTQNTRGDTSIPDVIISNHKCQFEPHVAVSRVGGTVGVKNRDPIIHNTHITIGKRTFLNITMLPTTPTVTKPVKQPVPLIVQCDVHKFMKAYVMTFDHAFASVSNDEGNARFTDVPTGKHTVTLWHEALGTQKREVSVTANSETVVTFEYSDGDLTRNAQSQP